MQITILRDMDALQLALAERTAAGKRIAFVPTMGALHSGHLSLIEQGRELADEVLVSIFVNPKQFGPNEDFAKYPRMLDADVKKAHEAGAALIYAPSVEDLYPEGFATSINAGPLSTILDGAFRPGHFDGVATVVTKLLLRIMPHVAIFGEKDYQQLCIIRRVAEDLDLPVEIIGAPIIREADGLAMSSRNAYLTPQERTAAPRLYEILSQLAKAIASRSVPLKSGIEQASAALAKSGFKVDYLELRESETLAPLDAFAPPARLLVAAWLGKTRLIDNIELE